MRRRPVKEGAPGGDEVHLCETEGPAGATPNLPGRPDDDFDVRKRWSAHDCPSYSSNLPTFTLRAFARR